MTAEKSEKTKIKEELQSWILSVQLRNKIRITAKQIVKEKQSELKKAKYVFGQTNKAWVEARKKVKTIKGKLSTLDYRKRKYCKEHFGKVLNEMQELK